MEVTSRYHVENHNPMENLDFLGVTAFTQDHDVALKCCKIAKEINPKIRTIAGGIHPTMFPNLFLETGYVDYVLKGEGEISFPKLLENPNSFPPEFWGATP
ncbi:MAG: cobalamin-dependent protein, partial [Candidatus Odinarchaeota archaeon]